MRTFHAARVEATRPKWLTATWLAWNTWSGDRDHDCKPSRADCHPRPRGSAVDYPSRRSNNMLQMQQRIRSKVRRSIQSVQSWNGELQLSTPLEPSERPGADSLSKDQSKSVREDQGCQRLRIHNGCERQWRLLSKIRHSRRSRSLLRLHRWSL